MRILSLDTMRYSLGAFIITCLISMFVSIVMTKLKHKDIVIKRTLISNSGVDVASDLIKLAPMGEYQNANRFYKSTRFLSMINSGENLCRDDIAFDFMDYCGSEKRMYTDKEEFK